MNLKKAVEFKKISHPYSSMKQSEIDEQTNCTVCLEDQELIQIGNIPAFRVCKTIASKAYYILSNAYNEGFIFNEITGYRVGMTRGDIDKAGNRTKFSNHSFGIAIDINAEQNGLYDKCITFSSECRLRKGGRWHPGTDGTLTENSRIVTEMKANGFKWGGEIRGYQKDFMHFSPTGY
ncbi:MAG: M15 family metallopeptidase [Gammaproteobacteria bacterium]|nr:M15 family metallopeptidase [Gammaproteobacteria bacterium]